ncbi:Crp/Fnr family transcriptional regulator [Thalassobaculum sp.]|uniref:Crp/Fnr family transcriptional regulator n=1 Tax=Thalassobaculum sp. TaxID=2022740 RepID=UPI0032EDAF07
MTPDDLLARHDLLGILSADERQALLRHVAVRAVAAGQTLFRRGDPGDGLYGVLSGGIVVTVESAEGKELILNRFGPGEFFGEIALLDGKGRTANALVREAGRLLFLPRGEFLPFLERRPALAVRMIALLCDRLRRTTELFEDAALQDVPVRLAKQLSALAARQGAGTGETVAISQAELAQTLGVSREIVSRHLGVWREAGLVELGRGRIRIRDRAPLHRIVAGG